MSASEVRLLIGGREVLPAVCAYDEPGIVVKRPPRGHVVEFTVKAECHALESLAALPRPDPVGTLTTPDGRVYDVPVDVLDDAVRRAFKRRRKRRMRRRRRGRLARRGWT